MLTASPATSARSCRGGVGLGRCRYVAPSGEIIYEYTELDPSAHVANTLAALEKWKAGR